MIDDNIELVSMIKEYFNNHASIEIVLEANDGQEGIDLAKKYHVEKVILFGSRARGDYRKCSDVDLAFRGGKTNYFTLDVDGETSTLLEFDIVDLDKPVRSELLESIRREGIILYEKI